MTPPTTPAAPAAKYPGFGALLKRAIAIWKIQWWRMAVLGILPGVVGLVLGLSLVGGAAAVLALISAGSKATFVVVPLMAALLIVVIWLSAKLGAMHLQLALGADAGVGLRESWRLTKGKVGSMIWLGFLINCVAFGGFMLLIAPGLIWGASFAFAPFVLLRDGLRGRDGLVRARQLVKGDLANVIVSSIALFIATIVVTLPLSIAQGAFKPGSAGHLVTVLLNGILNLMVIGPIVTGFMFAIFESLHARKSANLVPMPRAKLIYTIAALLGFLVIPLMLLSLFVASKSAATRRVTELQAAADARMKALAGEDAIVDPTDAPEPPAQPSATETDTDGDGMTDETEASLGIDPLNPDTDGDGLGDGDEQTLIGTRASNHDTDGDGYSDSSEILNGFSPTFAGEPLSDTTKAIYRNALESGRFHEPTITTLAPLRQ